MSKLRHRPKQIIRKLRQAEVLSGQGKTAEEICRGQSGGWNMATAKYVIRICMNRGTLSTVLVLPRARAGCAPVLLKICAGE